MYLISCLVTQPAYEVNLISLPGSKGRARLSTSHPSCLHVLWGLKPPNRPPAQEDGEAGADFHRLSLCPLCLSPQTPQPREGGLCMNVTFRLVNHDKKNDSHHLPSGRTYP